MRRATAQAHKQGFGPVDFYPRSPCGERRVAESADTGDKVFLSTLSLRRATLSGSTKPKARRDFYPRSPCGERPYDGLIASANFCNFYPRSPCGERLLEQSASYNAYLISIHALLAESDYLGAGESCNVRHFYPRSPCGERQLIVRQNGLLLDFYPRSPCGERLYDTYAKVLRVNISIHALLAESDIVRTVKLADPVLFLSTLSLRRATSAHR